MVAEFLLKVFNPHDRPQGLIYKSSLNEQRCAVFDLDSSCCVEQAAGWNDRPKTLLGLVRGSVRMLETNG